MKQVSIFCLLLFVLVPQPANSDERRLDFIEGFIEAAKKHWQSPDPPELRLVGPVQCERWQSHVGHAEVDWMESTRREVSPIHRVEVSLASSQSS